MPITTYLQQHLARQLGIHGLTDPQIDLVANDVEARLVSLLSTWNDLPTRQARLFLGREEATFYEPSDADLDVRSLVVVAIRNSLVENLASTPAAAQQLGLADQVLFDQDVRAVTSEAIRYFAQLDLAAIARAIPPTGLAEDVFANLPTHYPTAWQAIAQLASLAGAEGSYRPISATPPAVPVGRALPQSWHPGLRPGQIVCGMERAIEPQLQRVLRLVANGVIPALFSDSIKMITRHPAKLFEVIEFVLSNDREVVTQNYYLRNGHVAQRIPLLRPAHTVQEARAKFGDRSGLCTSHEQALRRIAGYL